MPRIPLFYFLRQVVRVYSLQQTLGLSGFISNTYELNKTPSFKRKKKKIRLLLCNCNYANICLLSCFCLIIDFDHDFGCVSLQLHFCTYNNCFDGNKHIVIGIQIILIHLSYLKMILIIFFRCSWPTL